MAITQVKKNNLPSTLPIPNSNNMASEYAKYLELILKTNRTTSGALTWISLSSGISYSVATGEDGLLNKLANDYANMEAAGTNDAWIITAEDINMLMANINSLNDDIAGKASKQYMLGTNISTSWVANEQTILIPGLANNQPVYVCLGSNATEQVRNAYKDLNLQDGGRVSGGIVLQANCTNDKLNGIVIPVVLVISGDALTGAATAPIMFIDSNANPVYALSELINDIDAVVGTDEVTPTNVVKIWVSTTAPPSTAGVTYIWIEV